MEEKITDGTKDADRPGDNENPTSPLQTTVITAYPPAAVLTAKPSDRPANNEYTERQAKAAEKLNWITGVGVGIAIVTLFALIWTVKVTGQAADAAKHSADAEVASVRAWISVVDYNLPPLADINTKPIFIVVKNEGKTPATAIWTQTELVYSSITGTPKKIVVNQCPTGEPVAEFGAMQPDQPPESLIQKFTAPNYTPAQIKSISNRTAELYIHGCLNYGTVIGLETGGTTYFCSRLFPFSDDARKTLPCNLLGQIMK